jgi:hypothetical protein
MYSVIGPGVKNREFTGRSEDQKIRRSEDQVRKRLPDLLIFL